MIEKFCSFCKISHPIADLDKKGECKAYKSFRYKAWLLKNKTKNLNRLRKWRKENKEKIREWAIDNRDSKRASAKKWKKANKEAVALYNKKYRSVNIEKIRALRRKYYASKKNDPCFKLAHYLRNRINKMLKSKPKHLSAVTELGCSIVDLKAHIESLFKDGMCWENHGAWHIDHIRPLASFDLRDGLQFKEACFYKNLQPLWAHENCAKGDRWSQT